jgi:hypothetical protein
VVVVVLEATVVVVVTPPGSGRVGGIGALVELGPIERLSSSRSIPIRMPEPGGTHVYVSSWPAAPARSRSAVASTRGSVLRSSWNWLPPTYTAPRAMPR